MRRIREEKEVLNHISRYHSRNVPIMHFPIADIISEALSPGRGGVGFSSKRLLHQNNPFHTSTLLFFFPTFLSSTNRIRILPPLNQTLPLPRFPDFQQMKPKPEPKPHFFRFTCHSLVECLHKQLINAYPISQLM